MADGWIKFHRCLLRNPVVMKDADYFAVWGYLLLKATHTEYPVLFKGEKIYLHPGQLITGRKKIASDLHISESKVFRILNDYKSEQQIEQQTSNRNSLISIVNWELYQGSEQQDGQQMNNKRTTDEHLVNTNKNIKNNKNTKNNINTSEKSDAIVEDFEKLYSRYPKKAGKKRALQIYRQWVTVGRDDGTGKRVKLTNKIIWNAMIAYIKSKGTDADTKYWKNFDTLMNNITDYVLEEGEQGDD